MPAAKFFRTRIDTAPTRKLKYDRGTVFQLVNAGTGARNVDVHLNHINVDSGPGEIHFHRYAENVYIVLEGELEVVVEGERHLLGPNEAAWIPPGVVHTAGNAGTKGVAKVIEIYAPASAEPDFHALAEWPAPMKPLAG